jgi:hemolysin activation/secretion protein
VRAAQRADQVGAALTLRTATDNPYGGMRRELALTLDGQAGTFEFARPSLTAGVSVPLASALDLSLGAAAGTSFGDVPVQGVWYLGGPGSVRGFRTAEAGGESFWRARAELSRGQPAFKLALFSDAGWVGGRDAIQLDPMLISAGVGISTLDGIIRLDLAKALRGGNDWRVDLYLNGAF